LVSAMRMYFGHDRCAERCQPLVDVLDEFCASKECLRPLGTELLRGVLREQLRNLHDSAWTRQFEGGQELLRAINLSCVMLLSNISRTIAGSLLLELGTEESEVIASSLVVKCLRKVTKGLVPGKDQDADVTAVLEALSKWLRVAQPRLSLLSTGPGAARSTVDTAVCALLDGVREAVDVVQLASPRVATSWAQGLRAEERALLKGCKQPVGEVVPDTNKENMPRVAAVSKKTDTRAEVKEVASPPALSASLVAQ